MGAIDGRFVPEPAPDVVMVPAGAEGVVLEERTGHFHLLSAPAAVVWSALDGHSSLATTAAELAHTTGAPFEQVLHDTVALVDQLYHGGLVRAAGGPRPGRVGPAPDPASMPSPSWVEERFAVASDHSLTVARNGRAVTIRATDADAIELVGDLLGEQRVPDDPAAPTITIVVGRTRHTTRELGRVLAGRVEVTRSDSLHRLARVAVSEADRLLVPDEHVALNAEVLLDHEDRAVVVDDRAVISDVGARRLARLGFRRLERAVPAVPRDTAEIDAPPPRIRVDQGALARADDALAPPVAVGRFPIRAIVLFGGNADHLKVTSPARRIGSLVPIVTRVDGTVRASDLIEVGRVAERCDVLRSLALSTADAMTTLESLAHA